MDGIFGERKGDVVDAENTGKEEKLYSQNTEEVKQIMEKKITPKVAAVKAIRGKDSMLPYGKNSYVDSLRARIANSDNIDWTDDVQFCAVLLGQAELWKQAMNAKVVKEKGTTLKLYVPLNYNVDELLDDNEWMMYNEVLACYNSYKKALLDSDASEAKSAGEDMFQELKEIWMSYLRDTGKPSGTTPTGMPALREIRYKRKT